MTVVGRVESLWRYPVKSMAGEEIREAFVGHAGIYGDRICAFHNAAAVAGFPYLTGRELEEMVLYRPRFRYPDRAAAPPNRAEAEQLGPGLTPVYANAADLIVDVETPSGQVLAIDDPALLTMLPDNGTGLSLLCSDRAMTDCAPVSLISLQTVAQIGDEIAISLDKRRFRANVYAKLDAPQGFAEDAFVGRRLQIGSRVVVAAVDRDSRCKMVTIDPDNAQQSADIGRKIARQHGGNAGIYCAVMKEGMVRPGDSITLLD